LVLALGCQAECHLVHARFRVSRRELFSGGVHRRNAGRRVRRPRPFRLSRDRVFSGRVCRRRDGGSVAGATLAPLTGVLMMFELTGSYQIVLPLLVACGIAAAVVQGTLGGSIYTIGARRRGVRLSRGGAALSDLSVAQALDPVLPLPADLSYEDLVRIVGPTHHAAFPVMDGTALAGIVSV